VIGFQPSKRCARRLERWRSRLGLAAYRIGLERISPLAVCDERGRVGHELVGVVVDHEQRRATIFHTRRLSDEDVVHELLHVRHPGWSEAQVVAETERLLAAQPGEATASTAVPAPPPLAPYPVRATARLSANAATATSAIDAPAAISR
jgi:hypothetical protein